MKIRSNYIDVRVLRYYGRPTRVFTLPESRKQLDRSTKGEILPLSGLDPARDLPRLPRLFGSYEVGLFRLETVGQWFITKGGLSEVVSPVLDQEQEIHYGFFIHTHNQSGPVMDFLPSLTDLQSSYHESELVISSAGAARYYQAGNTSARKWFSLRSEGQARKYHISYARFTQNKKLFPVHGSLEQDGCRLQVSGGHFSDRTSRLVEFLPWERFKVLAEKWGLQMLFSRNIKWR